jgi:hypothetical protein
MDSPFVSDPSARHPLGCGLLGAAPHRLDPCDFGRGGGHPLEPQTPEKSFLFASHLEAREELGKRSAIERFFGRVFLFFHLQRPPLAGWSTMVRQVALTYTATIIVALAAQQAGRPELIRSPKRVLAHVWEGF